MSKKSSKAEFTFEEAVSELEEIVISMEEDQLPLQELIDKYERGAKLHKKCESFLSSAKKRLEIIANDTDKKTMPALENPANIDDDEIRLF